eukprot:CAMPEP_0176356150 /NCGR_PEP_ID=MMETSP0126-20121128/13808_1 /TAXON_ID=141414 ORGANISM="Strombidinopsis acuminatum, Strain SPMC142" /NCGR_SAMPLE_ID=MMETSP0126 /ASSEMBLY_ACC=CAM_ASM_000229 /LENGTH=78 /DNA_ID=CAMNT_0017709115 /DNA_START=427 /DNA_END=663 /DNA_ORIENTATION=-
MTDFKRVFDQIVKIVQNDKNIEDLTVIFFTDGQDTCNQKDKLQCALDNLSIILKSSDQISSKIMSIGFSSGHDAAFMN